MSRETVHSHSYQHFEDLQLSAKDFYFTLRTTIAEYQFPKVSCGVTSLNEGSIVSSSRDYLCINKGDYYFYVCAAPFGKSFFISWWLAECYTDWQVFWHKIMGRRKESYYEMDSRLMFQNSINTLIKNAVDKIAADHAFRQTDAIVS